MDMSDVILAKVTEVESTLSGNSTKVSYISMESNFLKTFFELQAPFTQYCQMNLNKYHCQQDFHREKEHISKLDLFG